MKIKLIGAPVQEGAGRLGCDMGPAAFRAAGLAGALRDLGHDVDVFERTTGELTGFGAGIVAHEVSTRYFVQRTPTWLADNTVPVRRYRLLDGSGRLLWEEPVAYRFVSWGSLYRALLGEFDRKLLDHLSYDRDIGLDLPVRNALCIGVDRGNAWHQIGEIAEIREEFADLIRR